MNCSVTHVLTLLTVCLGVSAICYFPWIIGEIFIVCKGPGARNCIAVKNSKDCVNLNETFIWGSAKLEYSCTAYSEPECPEPNRTDILTPYFKEFLIPPKSVLCTCDF